ncbi:MAG: ATP-binding protein [Candidatus Saccharimonadales bacterium]
MLTAITFITSIAQILVCLFVLSRGRKNLSNLLFFFIGVATLGWALSNYLVIISLDSPNLIHLVRTVLFFVVIQNASFYLFARTFPSPSWMYSKRKLLVYLAFTGLAAAATVSPYLFTSVEIQNGLPVTKAGPAILLFMAHAAFSIFIAFKVLIHKTRTSTGIHKNQLQVLLFASFLTWVLVPITNFAITPLLQTTIFITIAPVYTLLFASIIAYAIVAKKLFDIKLIVVRAVAYLLSLAAIGGIYGGTIYLLTAIFNDQINNPNYERAFFIFFALVTALSFRHIKDFFDRTTSKLFYRDAYDPQSFLDQLNKSLVGNIEIGILLRHTAAVIEENIKADCHIYVKETGSTPSRIMGTTKMELKTHKFELIRDELNTISNKVVVTDELEDHYTDLKQALEASNIGLISSLITSYAANKEATAYLILGPKKSGNPYSKQDVRIINIITDELLIAIQNALRFEEIQSFNITLQDRVNDATAKLKRTNEKLKELDETKDEFISMASHQLRTPLTSVKGYLSMVLEGDAGKITSNQQQLLNQAFISSQRMVFLIADLLNVSRLKTGKFVIDKTPTNLSEMVEGELSQLTEVAKGRKLALTFNKPKDFPILNLDETKTRQVVMNFVDNAIYYTPAGGKIKLELRADRSSVYFMVKDNGLGVPKNEQSHLFGKFYRAKNAQKVRPDGTGLGLFMAKKVINDQGGTILFESTEGKGSTFGFKFDRIVDKADTTATTSKPKKL